MRWLPSNFFWKLKHRDDEDVNHSNWSGYFTVGDKTNDLFIEHLHFENDRTIKGLGCDTNGEFEIKGYFTGNLFEKSLNKNCRKWASKSVFREEIFAGGEQKP